MKSKSIAVIVLLPLACAVACGSSDAMLTSSSQAGGAGDAGDAGDATVGGRGGLSGAAGTSASSGGDEAFSGAGGSSGSDVAGSAGLAEQSVGGQAGAIGAGGAQEEVAGSGQSAGAGDEATDDELLGAHCTGCTATPLGTAKWKPVGAVMAPGLVGSSDTDTQPFYDFLTPIVAPNHIYNSDQGVWGPGAAHAGPYLDEGFALLSAASVATKQSFTTADFTAPSGALLTINLVPVDAATLGSSPDFVSGPVIPNALFPLQVDGDLFREGVLYDGDFDGELDGFDTWQPPLLVDGASHVMLWFGENSSFKPNVMAQGSYVFKISVLDGSGSGWEIDVPFTVSDAPNP